jgi:hypothetical protein
MDNQVIQCPHCKDYVWIEKLNCGIFRHACFKNGEPIPPHSTQAECEAYLKSGTIMGCAKPFQVKEDGNVVVCDYI